MGVECGFDAEIIFVENSNLQEYHVHLLFQECCQEILVPISMLIHVTRK